MNVESAIRSLKTKICCLIGDAALITEGEYYDVKRRYEKIVREVGHVAAFRDMLKELRDLFRNFKCLFCYQDPPAVELSMQNFLDTDTTNYPVGVFNVDGDFLGVAASQAGYAAIWNADLANQAHGQLIPAFNPMNFFLPHDSVLTAVRGLRYYEYTGPANLQLFVGANDIVHFGSTLLKGSANGTLITNTTRREWDRNLFAGTDLNSTVASDTVYTLNCTGYTDSSSLKVFHNEDSEYAAVSHSNGFYTISGYYPRALKATYYAGRQVTDYRQILNWTELTDYYSFYSFSTGGAPWGFTPAFFPTDLLGSDITQLGVGQDNTATQMGDEYGFITDTNFPNLEDLVVSLNTGDALTGGENWFLTMPKVTNYFTYRTQTVTQVAAAVADAVWNNVATALTGIVPSGLVNELRIQRTNNVTAASLTARNDLAAAGWTVLTN